MILTKWQWRADTAANWTASNPTLAAGEVGFEKDTLGLKVGDGVTAWATLPYLFPVGGLLSTVGGLITASQGVVTGAITSAVSAVEGYLSGTTVPAISAALAPVRVADAGNSSVAAIGNLGVFTGAWHRTDGPGGVWARVDIALTLAAAGTLAVQHSDDGVNPIAALTETWVVTAAAHPSFPTELKRTWYRVVLTDTGGGGAVTLAATLDPRPVDHENYTYAAQVVPAGGNVTMAIPMGCHHVSLGGMYAGGGLTDANTRVTVMYAGLGVRVDNQYLTGTRLPTGPQSTGVYLDNPSANEFTHFIHWYN